VTSLKCEMSGSIFAIISEMRYKLGKWTRVRESSRTSVNRVWIQNSTVVAFFEGVNLCDYKVMVVKLFTLKMFKYEFFFGICILSIAVSFSTNASLFSIFHVVNKISMQLKGWLSRALPQTPAIESCQ
jgi:hypothetical protein